MFKYNLSLCLNQFVFVSHRHVDFMADASETYSVQLLQNFQQPLKPGQEIIKRIKFLLKMIEKEGDCDACFADVLLADEAPLQVVQP